MAIGAQRSSVYKLVMQQAGWLTGIGLAIGLVCSLGASLLIRNLLFGVQAWDVATLSCVAACWGWRRWRRVSCPRVARRR
ncbi:MAG: hypothetical protein WCA20_35005 [Candidatus Sulfotelmatobacter sp.]